MKPATKRKKAPRLRFRLGDRVEYYIGPQRWRAEVVEDRGKLGFGGRRIYRIRTLSRSPGAERTVEMPEDLLKLVRRKSTTNGKS
jgi:hypothetical protein